MTIESFQCFSIDGQVCPPDQQNRRENYSCRDCPVAAKHNLFDDKKLIKQVGSRVDYFEGKPKSRTFKK